MENLIGIEKYLTHRLKDRINSQDYRVWENNKSYGTEVWDIIMDIFTEEECTGEKLQDYIKNFKKEHGENEVMWYDEFSEEMIFCGMAYALKVCVTKHIQEEIGDFNGLVILPLKTPENNLSDYNYKSVIYNTLTGDCYVNVIVSKENQDAERWELNECFSSYIDFLRYV